MGRKCAPFLRDRRPQSLGLGKFQFLVTDHKDPVIRIVIDPQGGTSGLGSLDSKREIRWHLRGGMLFDLRGFRAGVMVGILSAPHRRQPFLMFKRQISKTISIPYQGIVSRGPWILMCIILCTFSLTGKVMCSILCISHGGVYRKYEKIY